MEFKEYQKESYIAIQPHTDKKDEILNWSIGLSEEVGEVMNHIKHLCWGGEEIESEEIAKEMGDVLWYLSSLATAFNIDLDAVAQLNYEKLNHRFGGDFTEEASKARHEKEEKFKDTDIYKDLIERLVIENDSIN